jgi:hypothetical protein
MKRYKLPLSRATPISANTMFLQIGERYILFFSASPILLHIANNLGSSSSKTLLHSTRWWPLKINEKYLNKKYSAPQHQNNTGTRQLIPLSTHRGFSRDNTFKSVEFKSLFVC